MKGKKIKSFLLTLLVCTSLSCFIYINSQAIQPTKWTSQIENNEVNDQPSETSEGNVFPELQILRTVIYKFREITPVFL